MKSFPTARLLLALVVLFSAMLPAQTSRGTVTGVITDQTKAAVPNATVEIVNKETSVTRTTTTNEQGVYRFDAVDPGVYDVSVQAQGFRSYTSRAVPVSAAQVAGVDATLEVGDTVSVVEVTADAVALQTETPVRGGTINTVQATQLPIFSRNPNLLAITLPGVTQQRSNLPGIGTFSANGGRTRSNNFLLDGTENNDISVAGQAFQVKNPEAVQEVSVQTGLYDAEFGRAGGAVINTITKSGTNEFHGSLGWVADFTNDDAITNTQSLSSSIQARGKLPPGYQQYYNGTLGGPIVRNKTFFFTSWQEERQRASNTTNFTVPTQAGRDRLRALFPQGRSANLDTYLDITKSVVATGQPTTVDLGDGRGAVEFGTAILAFPYQVDGRQFMTKIDHQFSERDLLSVRYGYDRTINPTAGVNFPGFFTSQRQNYHNVVVNYTKVFSPTLTNELRLPYNRIGFEFPVDAADPRAATLPDIAITGLSSIGVSSSFPQGRIANNYALQDTMSYVHGKHTFRFGLDLLQQRSRQTAPASIRGYIGFGPSNVGGTYHQFANFIDNYVGSGSVVRDFGSATYYPELFRQAYFVQDRWQMRDNITVTLGLRWEDFGTPVNSLPTPAFTGLFNVPVNNPTAAPALQPNRTTRDLNNFAPVVGITYSPKFDNGLLGSLFGNRKTVFRTGFNMGYDSFFNNIASNAATSIPNMITTTVQSLPDTANPRGLPNATSLVPQTAGVPLPNGRQDLVIRDLRNPYYARWSAGLQRELPWGLVFDGAYVGSSGVRLFQYEDLNPTMVDPARRILPNGFTSLEQLQTAVRAAVPGYALQPNLDPLQGIRYIRTNGGHSSYHSGQFQLQKRFTRDLGFNVAYTVSKMLDNASEIFSFNNSTPLSAIPAIFGGQHLEKAPSLFDRPYRLVISYNYQLPMFREQRGAIGRVLGGWRVAGVTTFESGVPLNVSNGADADGFGGSGSDRPDLNPSGRAGVRARPDPRSSTGYVNPDVAGPIGGAAEIDPAQARYIGLPQCTIARFQAGQCRPGTAGRNTERTPGINNFDVNLFKNIRLTERFNMEFRTEFFNVFNTPQYGVPSPSVFHPGSSAIIPASNVTGSLQGRFLQYQYLDGGARVIRYNLTLRF
jgi:hypothetical protein